MNSKQDPMKLILVPVMNMMALAAIVLFGYKGLLVTFIAMLIYHLRFSVSTAAISDLTLGLTVLPVTRFLHDLYHISTVHLLGALVTFSVVLVAVSTLGKTLQASRVRFNHPL
jgi:hypothetical protein